MIIATTMEASRSFLGIAVLAGAVGLGGALSRWRAARQPERAASAAVPAEGLPFTLTEASAAAGLVNVHQKASFHPSLKNIEPLLAATAGAAVAVADYDGDGWMDVYAANSAQGSLNKLFRNNGDGTFTDVAAKAGAADVNRRGGTLSALFFDADDDGRKDLLLRTLAGPRLLLNRGGRFRDATGRSGLEHAGFSYAMNVLDHDGDGCADVVFGGHFKPVDLLTGPAYTRFLPNSQVTADNGGPTVLYRGRCDGTFAPAPGNAGIANRGFVHAVGAYDLRGTGKPDLYFASDFGSDQLALNEGGGRFSDASAAVASKHSKSGMSAEIADVDNDGKPAVFVTNIHEPSWTIGENALWKWTGGRGFENTARAKGLDRCGWAWGAKFVDLDNDGWQDLVVANGFLSADPAKSYWYTWSVIFASRSSFIEDSRNWPPMKKASLAGYQRDCVFWNRGGSFTEVGALTGLKSDVLDGRAVAAIDARNDGNLGVIVSNSGQPLRYYRVANKNPGAWIGFSLSGRRSGRDALGARVSVRLADGRVLSRQVAPANGYLSQSDPRLHFGLGAGARVERVEVAWPGGAKQTLRRLQTGRYHAVTEPGS